MAKIVQTAGRDALGEFAPEFAHFNDDVLFGENWNNEDIDLKTRSIITVVALMAQGNHRFFPEIPFAECKRSRCITERNFCNYYTCRFLCGMAESMGSVQSGKRSLGSRRIIYPSKKLLDVKE